MDKGILYGVGVGPGDPQLMTLKAVEVIGRCPVVAAPRTRNGGMVALDIASGAMDLSGKTILPLDFAMSHDADACAASHRKAAHVIREHLDEGLSVAMLNLGDISIYASFRYVADLLTAEGYAMRMIAGVPSFCAAAAELGVPLTDMGTPLHIIPDGAPDADAVPPRDGTTIWMKAGKNLPLLLERLRGLGLEKQTLLVQNCGMPDQRVYATIADAEIGDSYFTVVILKNG